MQDMRIEYRDGKLVELSIDGVSFLSASAISFRHTADAEPPTIILTMSVGVGERLKHNNLPRENLRIIEK